jgi:hypothetical protein
MSSGLCVKCAQPSQWIGTISLKSTLLIGVLDITCVCTAKAEQNNVRAFAMIDDPYKVFLCTSFSLDQIASYTATGAQMFMAQFKRSAADPMPHSGP